MRTIYDPTSGADVTATVQTALRSSRNLFTRWLFRFQSVIFWGYNPYLDDATFSFSNDFPIFVNMAQVGAAGSFQLGTWKNSGSHFTKYGETFIPTQMQIEKLEYGIGFEDRPVDLIWYIDDSIDYAGDSAFGLSAALSPPNMTLKKAFIMGAFNSCPFWIYQALFSDDPSKGGTFYGTTLMFRGYLTEVKATSSGLVLSLSSLMDVFQQVQVPTQTIMPSSRVAPFIPGAGGTFATEFVSIHQIVSPTQIIFQPNIIGNVTYAQDDLRDYWMNFSSASYAGIPSYGTGRPAAPSWRILGNDAVTNGPYVTVYFYEAPIIPNNPADCNVYGQVGLSAKPYGFPSVPPPDYNL